MVPSTRFCASNAFSRLVQASSRRAFSRDRMIGAVAVFVALDIKLDHVAGLDVRLGAGRAEFLEGDAALGLQADIDDGEFVGQADHAAGDDGAVEAAVNAEGFVEEGGEIFAPEMVLRGLLGARGGGCCHEVGWFRYGLSGPCPVIAVVCAFRCGKHGLPASAQRGPG